MNLDDYRFSMEWARIEPTRDTISEEALVHYDQLLDGLLAANIRPNVTIHHFSGPVWAHDPRDAGCANGPSDTNLCGWSSPDASELIAELAEHAGLLARRYGGKVDNWATINEPFNYILAGYGFGVFPPGQSFLLSDWDRLVATYRNFAEAHVAIYNAIKANDTIDADGDGIASSVGLTLSVIAWQPSRNNKPSTDPADIAAAARMDYAYNVFFAKAVYEGGFDSDLDGTFDEQRPDWQGKLDWLGLQYYFQGGVTARSQAIRQLGLTPCYPPIDFGSCIRPEDNTHWVPEMRYAFWEPGLYDLLVAASRRWPDLPLLVSESGLATHEGQRRAEHVTRSLEQIHRAITSGADVRGYYHWSLTDNFEWAEGFGPRFGLYTVDYTTYARTATAGATTLGEIAAARTITEAQRALLGGLGPMTVEPPLP
jgi:beta-glucosidase